MRVLSRTKKDVLSEFRRTELLTAARSVFGKKGFDGAKIDDIAEAAGVAKGTVYLYFESKQDIYMEALRFGIENLNDKLRSTVAAPATCQEKLRNLVAAKIAFFDEHRDFFRILQAEFGKTHTQAAMLALFKDLYFEQVRIIEKLLQEGVKEGVLRKMRIQKAALAISDLTRGIAIQRVMGWSKTRLREETDFVLAFLWKGIAK